MMEVYNENDKSDKPDESRELANGKPADGKSADGKSADGKSADGKSAKPAESAAEKDAARKAASEKLKKMSAMPPLKMNMEDMKVTIKSAKDAGVVDNELADAKAKLKIAKKEQAKEWANKEKKKGTTMSEEEKARRRSAAEMKTKRMNAMRTAVVDKQKTTNKPK
jgi:hypothetical protein